MLKLRGNWIVRYGTPLGLVLIAVVFKLFLIKQSPTLPFVIAVMLSAWFGGIGPGVMTVLLAAATSGWILVPKHTLNGLIENALAMGFFLVVTQAIAKIYQGHLKTADAVAALARGLEERDRQLQRAQERLENENRIQKAILNSIGEGVAVADANGEFLHFNPAAKDILGIDHNDAVLEEWSAHFGLFLPDTVTPYPPQDLPLARALQGEAATDVEVFVRNHKVPHGTWLSVNARPLMDEGGLLKGAVAVFRDVSANKLSEQAQKLAREAAEEANRAKSEFLSRMSHELRTPLNSILGFAQVLQITELTAKQHDSLEYILKGGRHLLALINEVLDIARIEAGRLSLSPEPVRLSDALQHALDLVRPMAAERAITIVTPGNLDCDRHVLADRQRLAQVLLNLLSNGIKYNQAGGRVAVGCAHCTNGRLRISIRDTGPGITPENLERLFSPFERLQADQMGVEGTGLGLALSKHLMEAMGGSIGVESAGGRGSTFWIELELIQDPLEKVQLRPESALQALAHRTASPSGTVLYIEDNLSNLRLMEHILESRPEIRLLAAMQGHLGLELARAHRPDLIFLDLHLPDIRGDEVLKELRQREETAAIPVVIVSADATHGQIHRLLSDGASGYLTKPIDVAKLTELVDHTLAKAGREESMQIWNDRSSKKVPS